MKWYFAINEEGTDTEAALLARLAVVSAQRHTDLKPHLLYRGRRNRFTAWMEDRGVTVLDVLPQFELSMQNAVTAGWYPRIMTGQWLRAEICNIETEDPFVLYTDIDVVFLRSIDLHDIRPRLFACAPEMNLREQRHFSAGVMLMNVAAMRDDYPSLWSATETMFADRSNGAFTDQRVYNNLYGGQQDRLDPTLNWKPYWDLNPDARIFHFHGPKLDAIRRMFDGTWSWNDDFGRFSGNLVAQHLDNYLHYFCLMLGYTEPAERLRDLLEGLLRDAPAAAPRLRAERDRSLSAMADREGADREGALPAQRPAVERTSPPVVTWIAEGPHAWRRTDGRALVVQDREGAWIAAMRQPAAGRPDPMFLIDGLRRIRSFPTDEDARRACDEATGPMPS